MKIVVLAVMIVMSFCTKGFAVSLEELNSEVNRYSNRKVATETTITKLNDQLTRATLLRDKLDGAIEAIEYLVRQETDNLAAAEAIEEVQDESTTEN